jgi:glycosyltransferase involved in cell wall biosynthesis
MSRFPPLALVALVLIFGGVAVFVGASVAYLPFLLLSSEARPFFQAVLWVQGTPIVGGIILLILDLSLIYPSRRKSLRPLVESASSDVGKKSITVVLTALNDEIAVGPVVRDFVSHPKVSRVVLVDNGSTDETSKNATDAGAIVVLEQKRGYGSCVHRALTEGAKFFDTDFVLLCEADGTFSATDIEKFLAYSNRAHVVLGTRIVELLREPKTQLTTFIYWGNYLAAKLLEFKHLGKATLSDLGTTYKLCRSDFLRDNLSLYDSNVNLEFNAHFTDVSLANGFRLVEIPIEFRARIGKSKGGNSSNLKAVQVGLKMLVGIGLSWNLIRSRR